MTTYTVYRVILDKDGQEDVRDYTARAFAEESFRNQCNRKGVFSAELQILRYAGPEATSVRTIEKWQRED